MNKKTLKSMDQQQITKFMKNFVLKLIKIVKFSKLTPTKTSTSMHHPQLFMSMKKKIKSKYKSTFLRFRMRPLQIQMLKLMDHFISKSFHQCRNKILNFKRQSLSFKCLIKIATNLINLIAKLHPNKYHFKKVKIHKISITSKKESQIKLTNVNYAQIILLSLIPLPKSLKPNLKVMKPQIQVYQNKKSHHKPHLFIIDHTSIISKKIATEESSANAPDLLH